MKKLLTILILLFSLAGFGQSGGEDHFKVKTDYLQIDNLQEISPVVVKVLIVDENGNVGYTTSISGAVTSVNGYSGVVDLNVTDLDSHGANSGDVPVADGSGGISWEAQSVGNTHDPVTLFSDDVGVLSLTNQQLDFVSSNLDVANLSSGTALENEIPIADGSGGITWGSLDLNITTDGVWFVENDGNPDEYISYNSGHVAIGSNEEGAEDKNLFVYGTVNTKEVIVSLSLGVPVPDYVFEEDYKLKPLEEVEAFIKENKHLPEIPSAKEVGKSGLNLSEMNLLLLKKVEELTLYMIEQQKEIEALREQIRIQD